MKDIRGIDRGKCMKCEDCDEFFSNSVRCEYCDCVPARHEKFENIVADQNIDDIDIPDKKREKGALENKYLKRGHYFSGKRAKVTLFCIPFTVAKHVYTLWVYGEFMCRTIEFMQGIYVEGSVLTMVCMSAERYLAIRHPMKMRRICSEKRIKQAIILTWIIAMIAMCPLIIFKKLDTIDFVTFKISFCREVWPSSKHRIAYDMFLLIAIYIIPGFFIVILYTLIGCSLCKPDYHLQRANSCISNEARIMTSRRKLARMMVILSILFALSWMPYFIITICLDFRLQPGTKATMLSIYPFALLLGHSNCAQNPILFCCMHRGFHDFVSLLIRCQCSRRGFKRTASSFSNGSSPNKTRMESIKTHYGNKEEKKRLMVQLSKDGSNL